MMPWPILRDARLRRSPQDEVKCAAEPQRNPYSAKVSGNSSIAESHDRKLFHAEKARAFYRPGRSSRLSKPAATLKPTWPCRLSGCNEIEFAEPPTSKFPPAPTPTDALPCAPA